jgi:hypothetical protein
MSDKIRRAERNEKPTRVFVFWSFVPEWWAKAIVWITGKQLPDKSDAWSHMGIGFEMSNGNAEYYEAIVQKGFVGPQPIKKLIDKINANNGRLEVEHLDMTEFQIIQLHGICKAWVGRKSYSEWQLIRMWFFERFGRWVGLHIRRTLDRLVCSEAVALLIYEYKYDLTDEIRTRFDEVNPNSAWRKWLKIKEA